MSSGLLEILLLDQKKIPDIYKPGPYWGKKSRSAIREFRNKGITDFRSSNGNNTVGTAFGGGKIIDGRKIIETDSLSNKIGLFVLNHTPLKKLFEWQVNRTQEFYNELMSYKKDSLAVLKPKRFSELIEKWKVNNSINFGCESISKFREKEYSTYYLARLDTLDIVENVSSLKEKHSMMEIGPGFGANMHLIEQNYPNIRKFVLVDIVPNLCVVTEYLKTIYKDAVVNYLSTRNMQEIKFKEDESLEIFVIPPWEIEKISSQIELFWNSNSFVEMNNKIIKNYAKNFERIRAKNSMYVFTSYDKFDLNTTLHPNSIPKFFPDMQFKNSKQPCFTQQNREDYVMIGTTKNNE